MPQLHVLTDPFLSRGRTHAEIVEAGLAGGCDVIQFRDKELPESEREAAARPLLEMARASGRLFVVNDHLDLALALGADGLHLGPDDLPVLTARERWRPPSILGASARTRERAREVSRDGADYLGVGPVFGTTSKRGVPGAIGLEGLRRVVEAVAVPVIGIGGIDATNAADVIRAGASGVAVISAVVAARDVEAATRALRMAIDRARTEPGGPDGVHHGGAIPRSLLG